MAGFVKEKGAQDRQSNRASYENDFYGWAVEQAELLRSGRLDDLDAGNVAEELLDVGRSEYNRLESALKVLLMHMLKWDEQPERRTRSWEASIREQRRRIERVLGKSPSLKPELGDIVRSAYEDARGWAAVETLKLESDFAKTCPYEWDDITARPFLLDK